MERKEKIIDHKSILQNPSFSSSLLDSIYRSIDHEQGRGAVRVPEETASYKGLALPLRKNRNAGRSFGEKDEDESNNLRVGEKWKMEKVRSNGKKSMAAASMASSAVLSSSNSNSSSSSSDSSFWSGSLSSSESEYSFRGLKLTSSSSSASYSMARPKPIRTQWDCNTDPSSQKPKKKHPDQEEVHVAKTAKSKTLKIYDELKKAKAKQPISPGGRLSSFLHSLFANTKKKPKVVLEPFGGRCDESIKVKYSKSRSVPVYFPSSSSGSSYSRSCISKIPSSSSGAKTDSSTSFAKRSVRFDPVSVILDESSQPCGQNIILKKDNQLKIHVMEENRRVAEAAKKLLASYRRSKAGYNPNDRIVSVDSSEDDGDDGDDGASCSSSDLFELDNLSTIGVERYREELPVYETTHVGTNQAIANGLIL